MNDERDNRFSGTHEVDFIGLYLDRIDKEFDGLHKSLGNLVDALDQIRKAVNESNTEALHKLTAIEKDIIRLQADNTNEGNKSQRLREVLQKMDTRIDLLQNKHENRMGSLEKEVKHIDKALAKYAAIIGFVTLVITGLVNFAVSKL